MKAALMLMMIFAALPSFAMAETWIRPDGSAGAKAIWGFREGMSVGIAPTFGPRGLIRIYTPYLNQSEGRILNFIAVEPIVAGQRGLSEMEQSEDKHQGKRMWTADVVDFNHPPDQSDTPARGSIAQNGNVESLSFFIIVENFHNGAKPIVKVTFHSDRPHDVTFQTFAAADSAPMENCVLTATMGNWSRLRHLHLKKETIDAADLFRNQSSEPYQFFPTMKFPADRLVTENGELSVSASGDADVTTPDEVPRFWRYEGLQAVQTWRTPALPGVEAHVNGREIFWGSKAHVPGGVAFENFELFSPFHSGQEFRFCVNKAETH